MAYNIEVKPIRRSPVDNAAIPQFATNNLTGTATGTWATIVANFTSSYCLVVSNPDSTPILISQSADAVPLQYFVVPANSQRIIFTVAGAPLKIKTG